MAETTSALPRPMSPAHPIPYSALHWGAPHEIHLSERQDALPAIFLCAVLRANRDELSARNRDAALLLRS